MPVVLMEKDNNKLLDILVFLLTISNCTGMHWWKGQQYAAGYLSVSSMILSEETLRYPAA
jgi:hypothetical protein